MNKTTYRISIYYVGKMHDVKTRKKWKKPLTEGDKFDNIMKLSQDSIEHQKDENSEDKKVKKAVDKGLKMRYNKRVR